VDPLDADLVKRVLVLQDRHAFAVLVRRHQSLVRHLLRRLVCGDAARADDLAQETFLRAWRGLAALHDGAAFRPWVCRIAWRVFLNSLDKKTEVPADVALLPVALVPGPAGRAALRLDLERAMVLLSPAERAALALAYGEDATREEIARVLDCPVSTVKTHVLRGKEKLRRALGAWEDQVTA
jgi:RNA polymerase sigma factor (sigma-70 family)